LRNNEHEGIANVLYTQRNDIVPKQTVSVKNAEKSWIYGYNEKFDMVVISKTGEIGSIIEIQNLRIALPKVPKEVDATTLRHSGQKWIRQPLPRELAKIKTRHQWKQMSSAFRTQWVEYINEEFERRENGYWFMNKGEPTYVTGSHYFYLQWASIDVGYPDYRDANRILYYFWEACRADPRCYGMCYLKIRRSGFSFMASSESINIGTLSTDAHLGITSKTGKDASSMFTKKVVPINSKLPFFFKPLMDGMDKPKTELSYSIPATKITKKNMLDHDSDVDEGLDTVISWRNTDDNAYDSEKLILLIEDEAAKILAPNNVKVGWRVRKTCLRLGGRIIGKCMMGSTSNALSKGGQNYKDLYEDSNVLKRNHNGETKSGLYALFIPMEFNTEGFIDEYGHAILRTPKEPVLSPDGTPITKGAIDWWENEVEGKRNDPDDLNEFYRQFPRTESHAFRDESQQSLFNLTKIYHQIDYNDSLIINQVVTQGNFAWENGIKDTKVEFHPNPNGRFFVTWVPPVQLRNRVRKVGNYFHPLNEHLGAFGCDPYDISGVVSGSGSKGSLHGLTKFHIDEGPTNFFFLEYIARPQTAEIFFEDVLMACYFYGMPLLCENNKPRLLYHFKNRGYRAFSMNRPDKNINSLSKTEREIGGIPSSSEDVKQAHASAIESYVDKYVGYDNEGKYRDSEQIGNLYFNRVLNDWARFDISNREKHDASISTGYAIMACNKHLYKPEIKEQKISITFARYDNSGMHSKLIVN
jgi:hypothetical protein